MHIDGKPLISNRYSKDVDVGVFCYYYYFILLLLFIYFYHSECTLTENHYIKSLSKDMDAAVYSIRVNILF